MPSRDIMLTHDRDEGFVTHVKANPELLEFIYKHVDKRIEKLMQKVPGIYVCGGAVRAFFEKLGEVKDVDFYFEDMDTFDLFRNFVVQLDYRVEANTANAITCTHKTYPPIQLIHHTTGDLEKIVNGFDFTMSMLGIHADRLYYHTNAVGHIEDKVLVYTGGKTPMSSLNRAFKFVKRGYVIHADSLLRLVKDIAVELDDNDDEYALKQLRLQSNYGGEE